MLTGIKATVLDGYTSCDHLIDDAARAAATAAVAGRSFRRAADAARNADRAYRSCCDPKCRDARVTVQLRNAYGDIIDIG